MCLYDFSKVFRIHLLVHERRDFRLNCGKPPTKFLSAGQNNVHQVEGGAPSLPGQPSFSHRISRRFRVRMATRT